MFNALFEKLQSSLKTLRSTIRFNDRAREIIAARAYASTDSEIFDILLEVAPELTPWRMYEHCSVVTRLYAIYEGFVEELLKDWIRSLPQIFTKYNDLPDAIKRTHQLGVSQLLKDNSKSQYKHLKVEQIIRGLFWGVSGFERYELIVDAFLIREQNLRPEAVIKLFANAGIENAWDWVNKHRTVNDFVKEILGKENTIEAELKKFISYRNDAAHSWECDDLLSSEELLKLSDLVEAICAAILELVTYHLLSQKEKSNQAREVGKIRQWFDKQEAARVKIKDITLEIGDALFLVNKTSAYCQEVRIKSIELDKNPKTRVEATDEIELSLKFNVNARKGLSLYVID